MNADLQRASTASLVMLDDYAFLAIDGERALSMLQGQLTCDVNQTAPDHVIEGAYCTPKGRVSGSFLLWARKPGRVLLRMRADIAEQTATALARYAALSRVTVKRAALACTGLLGTGLTEAAGGVLDRWPTRQRQIVIAGEHRVLQCDEAGQRYEIWSPAESLAPLRSALATRCREAPLSHWRLALVRERRVEIVAAIAGEYLPQMLDYDRSGAVSFSKGCYSGQEIVARARYKGSVKRRLYHLAGVSPNLPSPGDVLYQDDDMTRAVGNVVESATSDDTRVEMLAVLSEEAQPSAAARLRGADGSIFRVLADACAILE